MPATSWKTVRVFISSTFRDMQAERDWLVRFVFPKLREELLKHRIHFIDVDLRWGVTSDQDALGVCREVIDECHPRFMCILGGRYGWVPDGDVHSITADEVHYGVLGREEAKRGHSFFYFRNEKDTLAIPEADARSAGYREFAQPGEIERFGLETAGAMAKERANKLAALKQAIIDAELPVYHYEAKWSEAEKRLVGLEKFGERVHDDLLQSLKADPELAAHFTTEGTATPDEFAEERDQMEAFIEERVDQYILGSREPLMRDMLAFATADGEPNIFVLTGDPGSGKSAFLAKFCRSLTPSPNLPVPQFPSLLVVPHFIGASTGSTDLRRTLRRLCHELAKAAGNTESLPLDIKDLITHFHALLAEAAGRRRVILVFDALNQFDATDGAHWMNWLPRELPPGVRIVASTLEHPVLEVLRSRNQVRGSDESIFSKLISYFVGRNHRQRRVYIQQIAPLSMADTLAVITGYLQRYAKRLSPEQLGALLAKPAGCLPLYILTALEELRSLGTYEEITERIRTLPGDACALFGWILTERLARDPGFRDREGRPCGPALVEKFAACLGVSRHGLSPAELTALLDPGDPLGNVAALLRLLRPYLMRRGDLLDFYHGQFREAAVAAHLNTPEKQRAAHQSVATCLQAFADPHHDGQCRDATPHALSELPHHQTRAEAWPELIATLENIFFLEAKVTHRMAFAVPLDFADATAHLPQDHPRLHILRLLDETIRRDLHFVDRHAQDYPQALFQCLWNSCWWYDCHDAPHHYMIPENGWNQTPPWETKDETSKLSTLLSRWRARREARYPNFYWLRAMRPPRNSLGVGECAVFRGHDDLVDNLVFSVAISPDGHQILSGSENKTAQMWDAQTGRELAVLIGHEDKVTSVAFSPDGHCVLSGSLDNTVRLWNAQTGNELVVLREPYTGKQGISQRDGLLVQPREQAVLSVAFSPDGRRVLSGSGGKTVRLWDIQTQQVLAVFRGHESGVTSVAFSPDGQRVLSGSWDKTVRLWDVQNGRELAVLRGHDGAVNSVAFSPDGRRGLSGSNDTTIRMWDVDCCSELAVLHGHTEAVNSVAFSPDGRCIVSGAGSAIFPPRKTPGLGSLDNTVRIWGTESLRASAVFYGHEKEVTSVVFSRDGRLVVSGSCDNSVRIWNAASTQEPRSLFEHDVYIRRLQFSAGGQRVLSESIKGTARLWDAKSGRPLIVFLDAVQTRNAASEGDEAIFGMLGLLESQQIAVWPSNYPYKEARSCGDGRFLPTAGSVYDTENGCWIEMDSDGLSRTNVLAISPDGGQALGKLEDNTARLWDARTGRELAVFRGHLDNITAVTFSPDGRCVVSGSMDKTLRLWDAQSGREMAVLRGHESEIYSVAISPDGLRLLSGSGSAEEGGDSTVRLWDTQSGRELAVLRGHESSVWRVAFSPDGLRVLSWSYDDTVRLWDAQSGQELSVLRGHQQQECDVIFSPDGRQALLDREDQSVRRWRLWDVQKGVEIGILSGHGPSWIQSVEITNVAFSPDGELIVGRDSIGNMHMWEAKGGGLIEQDYETLDSRLDDPHRDWRAEWKICNPGFVSESVIRSRHNNKHAVFFPRFLNNPATHSKGRIWAGSIRNHLVLVRLEGGVERRMGD